MRRPIILDLLKLLIAAAMLLWWLLKVGLSLSFPWLWPFWR